jgi:hypothetical protein
LEPTRGSWSKLMVAIHSLLTSHPQGIVVNLTSGNATICKVAD